MTEDSVSLFAGSWNVGESEVNYANLKHWLVNDKEELFDIYMIGSQECASNLRKDEMKASLKLINAGRKEYVLFQKIFLMGIACIMIVHERSDSKISHLDYQAVSIRHGNILGNNGACMILFQFKSMLKRKQQEEFEVAFEELTLENTGENDSDNRNENKIKYRKKDSKLID